MTALTVVIPTFNEADNVSPLVRQLERRLRRIDAEIIFVDDSTDRTPEVIREVAATSSIPVRCIHRESPRGGLAGAVIIGMHASRSPWIVVMDGDLQHPPAVVPRLYHRARRSRCDVVVASRFRAGGSAAGLDGPTRRAVSSWSRRVAKWLFPRRLAACSDPMSGFFAIRRQAVALGAVPQCGYKILLALLVQRDLKVSEVAFHFAPRHAGASKASLAEGVRFLRLLAVLRYRVWRKSLRDLLPEGHPGGSWRWRLRRSRAVIDARTGRLEVPPRYGSADSAPAGYAVRRSVWHTVAFLATFFAAALAFGALDHPLTSSYAALLASTSGLPKHVLLRHAALSFRPLFFLFLVWLGLFAPGPFRSRLRFLATTAAPFLLVTVLFDTVLADNHWMGAPRPLSPRGSVAAVVVELAFMVWVVFSRYSLPETIVVRAERSRPARYTWVFAGALTVVATVVAVTFSTRREFIRAVQQPYLDGFASSILLFLVGVQVALFVAGRLQADRRPSSGPPLSVAFFVPAHNEAHNIEAVIRALDRAAEGYGGGPVRAIVVDNVSSDDTAAVARATFDSCRHLAGEVLSCPVPGKSYALNTGLRATVEDVVIRVDADTLVCPDLLERVVPYFWNDNVGGVSGIPLPREDCSRWLRAVRTMESLFAISFLRVGQSGADGTLVMPGNMSAYRGGALRDLGGFATGFNGEDTDIAVHLGRLGYRIVTDVGVEFYAEVPPTLGGLREQRQRWARSIFHVGARHKSSITMAQGARGLLWLPWAMANGTRRAVMLPLLVCALAAKIVDPPVVTFHQITLLGGVLLGAHLLIVVVLLVVNRRSRYIPYLPAYFLFRLFKLFVAFEALLSLALKPPHPALAGERLDEAAPDRLGALV